MKHNQYLPINLQYFGDAEPDPQPEPQLSPSGGEPEPTPEPKTDVPQFTQADINRIAAKEAAKAKASVLKQFGIDKEEDLQQTAAELKAMREAKAKSDLEKPEIERLKGELSAKEKLEQEHKAALDKLIALEQKEILRQNGFNPTDKDEMEDMRLIIGRRVTDGISFEDAAVEYFKTHPIKPTEPDTPRKPNMPFMSLSAGSTPINTGITKEEFKKLTYLEKVRLKNEKPEIYNALIKT